MGGNSTSVVAQFNTLFKASILLALLAAQTLKIVVSDFPLPKTCSQVECPSYGVRYVGDGYEIRKYAYSVWISAGKQPYGAFTSATEAGYFKLQDYIQGNNTYKKKIELAAPLLTKVIPLGTLNYFVCDFSVSLYLPAINQADPPPAEGFDAEKWEASYTSYFAVSQFTGSAKDFDVEYQFAALKQRLRCTAWWDAIARTHNDNPYAPYEYWVAQYHDPANETDWVNEIWISIDTIYVESADFFVQLNNNHAFVM